MKEKFDSASIIGFVAVTLALLLFVIASGSSFKLLLSIPPIIFIVVGSFAVTMVGFSLRDCLMVRRLIVEAFVQPVDRRQEIIDLFVQAARQTRRNGPLAIESMLPEIQDATIRKGLEMVVDGATLRTIRDFVEKEGERKLYPYEMGINFFRKMGGFSPTLGIVGTVVGLMSALASLSQFKQAGGSIAEAFVATLWGVAFANAVCFPVANKLEYRKRVSEEELEMIYQGLVSVEKGTSKHAMREKMASFVEAVSQ